MATAQINARIDAGIKTSGDRALDSIGYTPTKAIRALWGYAGRNMHDRKKLRDLFDTLEGSEGARQGEGETDWEAIIAEGPLIIERGLREMGVQEHAPSGLSDKELLEDALVEKMTERGLW